jgi:hypothetical protein
MNRITAWFNGRRDGKISFPLADDPTPAPFEQRVCAIANTIINKIHGIWAARDARMSGNHRTFEDWFQRTNSDYESKRQELGRDTVVEKLWHYYIILALIGLCEMAANIVAFRILGENNLFTYIMALAILFGIPMAGHFLGKSLKQGWQSTRGKILVSAAILVVIGCLIGFAFIRKDYISANGLNILSSRIAIFSFISLNLMLFFVCSLAAYMAYDSDPLIYDYKKKYSQFQRAFNNIDAARNAWSKGQEGKAKEVRESAITIIQIYRASNIRKRFKSGDGKIPESFKCPPDIPIPDFDWKKTTAAYISDDEKDAFPTGASHPYHERVRD